MLVSSVAPDVVLHPMQRVRSREVVWLLGQAVQVGRHTAGVDEAHKASLSRYPAGHVQDSAFPCSSTFPASGICASRCAE